MGLEIWVLVWHLSKEFDVRSRYVVVLVQEEWLSFFLSLFDDFGDWAKPVWATRIGGYAVLL